MAYKIAPGHIPKVDLTSGYDITLLNTPQSLLASGARPSDMPNSIDWLEPLQDPGNFIKHSVVLDGWGGRRFTGPGLVTWALGPWTPGMIEQWQTIFFPDSFDPAPVTIETLDATWGGGWVTCHAMIQWPAPDSVRLLGIYRELDFNFINVKVVT